MNLKITLPKEVNEIINTLERHGYEAYAVGGAVRDMCIGRTPGDFDVTTSALPEEVKALFPRTVDTGIAHGTVTIMKGTVGYEVTTYRIDGKYSDSRHPESVEFTRSLMEDLKRRDFTINAMAYNDRTGLVDLFDGCSDLECGMIRAVGDPEKRFREDALRIMRCVRFAAQLGFDIDEETLRAAAALSGNLMMISRERVREELLKILMSDHPALLRILCEIGGFRGWYDELEEMSTRPYCEGAETDAFTHMIRVLECLPKDRTLRLAAFLMDASAGSTAEKAAAAERILTDLKFDNETRADVPLLISCLNISAEMDKTAVRKLISQIGYTHFDELMRLFCGILEAEADESPAMNETIRQDGKIMTSAAPGILTKLRREIEDAGDCVSMKELKIGGKDLIRLGMKPGKVMGEILNRLFAEVLEKPECNTEEWLKVRAEEMIRAGVQ